MKKILYILFLLSGSAFADMTAVVPKDSLAVSIKVIAPTDTPDTLLIKELREITTVLRSAQENSPDTSLTNKLREISAGLDSVQTELKKGSWEKFATP